MFYTLTNHMFALSPVFMHPAASPMWFHYWLSNSTPQTFPKTPPTTFSSPSSPSSSTSFTPQVHSHLFVTYLPVVATPRSSSEE